MRVSNRQSLSLSLSVRACERVHIKSATREYLCSACYCCLLLLLSGVVQHKILRVLSWLVPRVLSDVYMCCTGATLEDSRDLRGPRNIYKFNSLERQCALIVHYTYTYTPVAGDHLCQRWNSMQRLHWEHKSKLSSMMTIFSLLYNIVSHEIVYHVVLLICTCVLDTCTCTRTFLRGNCWLLAFTSNSLSSYMYDEC